MTTKKTKLCKAIAVVQASTYEQLKPYISVIDRMIGESNLVQDENDRDNVIAALIVVAAAHAYMSGVKAADFANGFKQLVTDVVPEVVQAHEANTDPLAALLAAFEADEAAEERLENEGGQPFGG